MQVLDQINMVEQQVWGSTQETAQLRNEVSAIDAQNLNVRKEIEHLEAQLAGAKECQHEQYCELARLRDIAYACDKDIDA